MITKSIAHCVMDFRELRATTTMAAYLIADVSVTNSEVFRKCAPKVLATEEIFRAKYLARGGATQVLEGNWGPHSLVIVEFPDMSALLARYDFPEYAPLKEIRKNSAVTRIIAVGGTPIPVEPPA